MNIQDIFKNYEKIDQKLLDYGFSKEDNHFVYDCYIMNNRFKVKCIIKDDIKVDVIDTRTNEIFMPYYVTNSIGKFVGDLRAQVNILLIDIKNNCFIKKVFKNSITYDVINYINDTYGEKPEYLWKDTPNNAIFRNQKNKKWYAAILTAKKSSLGFISDEEIELINLKLDPLEIENIVDNRLFFPGYHMNKKYWLTIILDGRIPIEEIKKYIDKSYEIVSKK